MRIVPAFIIMCFTLSACSIHPQTEDYARDTAPDITHKIKCEAKYALLKLIPDENDYRLRTSLSLKFYFQITENNDASISGNYIVPIHLGSLNIGYRAGKNRMRQSTHQFQLGYLFKDLTQMKNCSGPNTKNYIYPITGEIGLYKLFRNYIRLIDENKNGGFTAAFSDELIFQTDFYAGVSPRISLTTVTGKQLNIGSASGAEGISADRSDFHRVTISITPLPTPEIAEQAKRLSAVQKAERIQAILTEKVLIAEQVNKVPQNIRVIDSDKKIIDFKKITIKDEDKPYIINNQESGTPPLKEERKRANTVPKTKLRIPLPPDLSDQKLREKAVRDLNRIERGELERELYDDFQSSP